MFKIAKNEQGKGPGAFFWVILIFLGVSLMAIFLVGFVSIIFLADPISTSRGTGNVAVIDISGIISTEEPTGFATSQVSSSQVVEYIKKAEEDESISAIMLFINSGGGSPVATYEIASEIDRASKPTVAILREVGASGAYWIASSADTIFANRMSIVGSIGATSSHIGIEGLMQDYNVTYRRLVSGEHKDIGTPLREMTEKEEKLMQERLDIMHEIFADSVAKNRGFSDEEIRELDTGLFWTGAQAKELGLIDKFGGEREAIEYIESKLDIKARKVEFKKEPSLGDLFFGVINHISYHMGKGFGSSMIQNEPVYQNINI